MGGSEKGEGRRRGEVIMERGREREGIRRSEERSRERRGKAGDGIE